MKISRTLHVELKREVFSIFSDELRRQMKERGLSEDEIVEDFKCWRKRYKHRLKPVPPFDDK
jgi:hypothetical protein